MDFIALIMSLAAAKASPGTSQSYAQLAEAYAKGTVDGVAVSEGDPGYHDNAYYYAQNIASSTSDDLNYILGV